MNTNETKNMRRRISFVRALVMALSLLGGIVVFQVIAEAEETTFEWKMTEDFKYDPNEPLLTIKDGISLELWDAFNDCTFYCDNGVFTKIVITVKEPEEPMEEPIEESAGWSYEPDTTGGSGEGTLTWNKDGDLSSSDIVRLFLEDSILDCVLKIEGTVVNNPTYMVTIPATLTVAKAGWNDLAGGVAAKGNYFGRNQALFVTAASANSWSLKSGENTVGYNLVCSGDASSAYSGSLAPASWEFTKRDLEANEGNGTTKTVGIVVEDYTKKPGGKYTDTVTFTTEIVSTEKTLTLSWDDGPEKYSVEIKYTDDDTWADMVHKYDFLKGKGTIWVEVDDKPGRMLMCKGEDEDAYVSSDEKVSDHDPESYYTELEYE